MGDPMPVSPMRHKDAIEAERQIRLYKNQADDAHSENEVLLEKLAATENELSVPPLLYHYPPPRLPPAGFRMMPPPPPGPWFGMQFPPHPPQQLLRMPPIFRPHVPIVVPGSAAGGPVHYPLQPTVPPAPMDSDRRAAQITELQESKEVRAFVQRIAAYLYESKSWISVEEDQFIAKLTETCEPDVIRLISLTSSLWNLLRLPWDIDFEFYEAKKRVCLMEFHDGVGRSSASQSREAAQIDGNASTASADGRSGSDEDNHPIMAMGGFERPRINSDSSSGVSGDVCDEKYFENKAALDYVLQPNLAPADRDLVVAPMMSEGGGGDQAETCESLQEKYNILSQKVTEIGDKYEREKKVHSVELSAAKEKLAMVQSELEEAKKRNLEETKNLKDQMAAHGESSSVDRKLKEEMKRSANYKQELMLVRAAQKRLKDTQYSLERELDAAKRNITELEVQVSTLMEMSAASKSENEEQLDRAMEAELCILDLRKVMMTKELKERSERIQGMRARLDLIIQEQLFKPPGDPTKWPEDDLVNCQVYRNQLDDNCKVVKDQIVGMEASFDSYIQQVRGGKRLAELAAISLEQSPPDPEIPCIPEIQRAMTQKTPLIRLERGNQASRDDESASGTAESGSRALHSPSDALPLGAEASAISGTSEGATQGSTRPKTTPVPNDPMELPRIINVEQAQQIESDSRLPNRTFLLMPTAAAGVGIASGSRVERGLASGMAPPTSASQMETSRREGSNPPTQTPRPTEPGQSGPSQSQRKIDRLRNLVVSGVHGVTGEPRVLENDAMFKDAIKSVREKLPDGSFKGNHFTLEDIAVLVIRKIRSTFPREEVLPRDRPLQTVRAAPSQSKLIPPPLSVPEVTDIGTKPKNPKDIDATWECAICMEKKTTGAYESCPGCTNYFHANCLKSWLSSNATCPVCRKHLRPGDEFPSLTV